MFAMHGDPETLQLVRLFLSRNGFEIEREAEEVNHTNLFIRDGKYRSCIGVWSLGGLTPSLDDNPLAARLRKFKEGLGAEQRSGAKTVQRKASKGRKRAAKSAASLKAFAAQKFQAHRTDEADPRID
jgi:hypothetical protein